MGPQSIGYGPGVLPRSLPLVTRPLRQLLRMRSQRYSDAPLDCLGSSLQNSTWLLVVLGARYMWRHRALQWIPALTLVPDTRKTEPHWSMVQEDPDLSDSTALVLAD